ncbi:MAG TPA: hypothetical protein VE172_08865 [Stackebrandtia sp.]|jgi:hypothetical protein|uniref:hypothetical protein n=1 Tax=Stackebrandtia sp. TaxID=2023065 RepID=UPI002D68B894|nr:hypothetical protein [Stackebrandtia sp.]HZE38907.1 hypothetical protein [Stackebrandtia sp.]
MTWNRIAGWSLILAPVGQLGGWAFQMLGGNEGAEPQSTIAHAVWLIGFVCLTIVCIELYRRVRSHGAAQVVARVSLGVALISVAASIAEMLVDLGTGFAVMGGANHDAIDHQVRGIPGVEAILYGPGTQLVYLGFLVLIIQLAVLKRIRMLTLLLVLATLVLFVLYEIVFDGPARQPIMPLACLCMWLALAPLGWPLLKRATEPSEEKLVAP